MTPVPPLWRLTPKSELPLLNRADRKPRTVYLTAVVMTTIRWTVRRSEDSPDLLIHATLSRQIPREVVTKSLTNSNQNMLGHPLHGIKPAADGLCCNKPFYVRRK